MENIDLIVLTAVIVVAFIVFVVTCFQEYMKMEKTPYTYKKERGVGREALFNILVKVLEEKGEKEGSKVLERVIADMEYEGIYFKEEDISRLREELTCEYSGLPSVKAYERN